MTIQGWNRAANESHCVRAHLIGESVYPQDLWITRAVMHSHSQVIPIRVHIEDEEFMMRRRYPRVCATL